MLDAIKKELEGRRDYLANTIVETVYFGGGTPSLLNATELLELWTVIEQNFQLSDNMEVTLEANPDDLTLERLQDYKKHSPLNRLSIGIQSFHNADLEYMNRAHNAEEALQCLENALAVGFQQLSIDFIYGTPTMTNTQWRENLHTAFALGIPHISCYALTVEPKTALQHLIIKGKAEGVSEEHSAQQFEILLTEIAKQGYEQYEISNFCKPPHYAKHNSAYWKGAHYLGVGPSAHSFNGTTRQWNIANNAQYMQGILSQQPNFELETLTAKEQYNEYILTALRTKWGAELPYIKAQWGGGIAEHFQSKSVSYQAQGYMIKSADNFTLSDSGKLLADAIISDLFW